LIIDWRCMAKLKSIAKLVDEAAVLMQKLVRMKAANDDGYVTCVTCGVVKHWKEMQGAHFISRRWTATKILEENIHPCCPCCNGPLRGNLQNYTLYMIDTYGREFVDELLLLKHDSRKYYRNEVEEIKKELRGQIAELEKEIA